MARYRTIKHELFADEKLAEVSREARLLFIGLWCFCDDKGRKQYSPTRIKGEVFPLDNDISPGQVGALLQQLVDIDVVRTYEAEGKKYLWIPHFTYHQRIDRPSHTDLPAHPLDRKPDCQCLGCRKERGDDNGHYHRTEHRQNVPAGTPRVIPESGTRRVVGDDSGSTPSSSVVECNVVERERSETAPSPSQTQAQPQRSNPTATNAENRRAQSADLREIAIRILELVGLPANPQILDAVTESVRVKARSEGLSPEESARRIASKACLVKRDSPPESWLFWFRDAKYDYVPQGDAKLKDRRYEARPTCGGAQCMEGWEYVTVDGQRRLRRCEACKQLWRDQGYSSE